MNFALVIRRVILFSVVFSFILVNVFVISGFWCGVRSGSNQLFCHRSFNHGGNKFRGRTSKFDVKTEFNHSSYCKIEKSDLLQYVDILRGTDNLGVSYDSNGNMLPVHARPFGMNHWTLVTSDNDRWFFKIKDKNFQSVRCTHRPSPWVLDWAFFDVIPIFGGENMHGHTYDNVNALRSPTNGTYEFDSYCSIYSKHCPTVEITATVHGSLFRMNAEWREKPNGVVMEHLDSMEVSEIADNKINIKGKSSHFGGSASRALELYVFAEVEPEFRATVGFNNVTFLCNSVSWSLNGSSPILIRIGTSFISFDRAKLNLQREVSNSYDDVVKEGNAEWNNLLSRLEIEPDESFGSCDNAKEMMTIFYTCLYRALLFPIQLGELDENGNTQHRSPYSSEFGIHAGPSSTDSGFWDVYRSVYPMLHLIYPDIVNKLLVGWLNAIREDPESLLPQWSAPDRYDAMVSSMGEVTMAEAIVNGALSENDAMEAYQYLKKSSTNVNTQYGRRFLSQYIKYGYIPSSFYNAVSVSLNYYLADYAVARAAEKLSDFSFAKQMDDRSKNWKKLFDPSVGFFQPKDKNGIFDRNFKQFEWTRSFTEGGAWQYRFYVPEDPAGLRQAYEDAANGKSPITASHMCDKLLEMMTIESTVSNALKIHEMTELKTHSFGQYGHNNQPVHHVLYMFPHAGCWLEGQKWTHHTLYSQYGKFGFAGDEDNGEMSSWYILSSIGLYALVPGSGKYQVGAPPLFKKLSIRRPNGSTLTIRRNVSLSLDSLREFHPAKQVSWNGRLIDLVTKAATIDYSELMEGGELVFL